MFYKHYKFIKGEVSHISHSKETKMIVKPNDKKFNKNKYIRLYT